MLILPFRPTFLLRGLALATGIPLLLFTLENQQEHYVSTSILITLWVLWFILADTIALILWLATRKSGTDNPWVRLLMVDRDHLRAKDREHLRHAARDNPTLH